MSSILIKNGNVILKDRILEGASVLLNGARIASIGRNIKAPRSAIAIDAKDCFVSPGFIDSHIHGLPETIFANEAKYGTTSFVVSESCAPLHSIYKKAQHLKLFISNNMFGANVLGMRLEGPYISFEKAGAQDPSYIRLPDLKTLSEIIRKLSPVLKIMTVAPELGGAQPVIRLLRKNNIIASIGHSDATYEKAIDGIDTGITHATHTFNAMSSLDRRSPGVVGAVLLDDRVTAEVILDLVHVHKALFTLLLRLKKKNNIILISDSIRATGKPYRFADGRLAGSSLTMIRALRNAVKDCEVPLVDAVRFMTVNPARLLGVESYKGSIEKGKDADIVVFDKGFEVKATVIRGKIAYESRITNHE